MKNTRLGITWEEVLKATEGNNIVPLGELNGRDGDVISFQHITKDNIKTARRMALLEMEKGVAGTFFLCSSRHYFNDAHTHLNYLIQLRHEVAFEFDLLTIAQSVDKGPHYHIVEVLLMADRMGAIVHGIRFTEEYLAGNTQLPSCLYFYEYSTEDISLDLIDNMGNKRTVVLGVHPIIEYRLKYLDVKLPRDETIVVSKIEKKDDLFFNLQLPGKKIVVVETDEWE